jgi:uncharacterized protein YcgI (DUF1989 family)
MNEVPQLIAIPARRSKLVHVKRGQVLKVINTHGSQVVDTWAFTAADPREFMSMEHSRVSMMHVAPRVGDVLVTNRRRAILRVTEDTTPGVHDTMLAACDRYRYELLGAKTYHDNCTDNLAAAMKEAGISLLETPCPLNLFQNSPVLPNGNIAINAPVSMPGQYIAFTAEVDLIAVFSCCPQDMVPLNGEARKPTEAHVSVS